MKRCFLIFLLAVFYIQIPCNATIAGNIYPTDIKTYLFGEPIRSYNIGGETIIICEDLNWYYGFDVVWNPDERTLRVDDKWKDTYYLPEDLPYMRDISQNIKNLPESYFSLPAPEYIYTTDIQTYLNGNPIRSYNVGGETAIVCEDLTQFGYTVEWNAEKRTLNVGEKRTLTVMGSDVGDVIVSGKLSYYDSFCTDTGIKTFWTGAQSVGIPSLWSYEYQSEYLCLTDILEAYKTDYILDGDTLYIDGIPVLDISEGSVWNAEKEEKDIYKILLKINVNGTIKPITVIGGGTMLTNGQTYEKEVSAYLYNGKIYIPSHFFESSLSDS